MLEIDHIGHTGAQVILEGTVGVDLDDGIGCGGILGAWVADDLDALDVLGIEHREFGHVVNEAVVDIDKCALAADDPDVLSSVNHHPWSPPQQVDCSACMTHQRAVQVGQDVTGAFMLQVDDRCHHLSTHEGRDGAFHPDGANPGGLETPIHGLVAHMADASDDR